MIPVLFNIGPFPVSSFGVFLVTGFLASVFIAWRIAKAYDLNETKIIDLSIFTFFGGLIFSRLYFVITHQSLFNSLVQVFIINKYPGLSFWGGFWGALIILYILIKRTKLNFWQISDLMSVATLLGLSIGSLGCFLGGCGIGIASDSFLAVNNLGFIGKRLPVEGLEAIIFLIFFLILWNQEIKFHFQGKITALFLIFLGLEKFMTDFMKQNRSWEQFQSFILITLGVTIFYILAKKSLKADIKYIFKVIFYKKERRGVLLSFSKSCYNARIYWQVFLGHTAQNITNLPGNIRRKINVKPTPGKYQ
jgi:phosphatidylglycerol:prolipoprotein diacylglycerol transferase